jgi:pyruvate dehydrogenase E1 component
VIFDRGERRMMEGLEYEFYYITVMNENYVQPSMPMDVEDKINKRMYLFARRTPPSSNGFVRLLGSGAILREVIQGSRLLEAEWCVSSEVWSITSYAELALDARAADRRNRLNPSAAPIQCHLAASLPGEAAVIAASDYVCAYPRLIAGYVEGRFTPWNGWLWPQRHARRSARLLRGRPPSCCDRRAFSACFSRRDCERQGRRGDCAVQGRHER